MHDLPPPVHPLTFQLVAVAGQLSAVLAHMDRFAASGGSSPDAPHPLTVLTQLLDGALAPLVEARPDDAMLAAGVIDEAAGAIEHEILLVAPQPLGPARPRRRGSGGRPSQRPRRRRG